jgi:hypothetical protein
MGAYQRADRGRLDGDLGAVYELFPQLRERHEQRAGSLSGGEQQMMERAGHQGWPLDLSAAHRRRQVPGPVPVIDVGVDDPAFARVQLAATTGEIALASDSLEMARR